MSWWVYGYINLCKAYFRPAGRVWAVPACRSMRGARSVVLACKARCPVRAGAPRMCCSRGEARAWPFIPCRCVCRGPLFIT